MHDWTNEKELGKGKVFSSDANKGKVFPVISVDFLLLIAVLRDVPGFKTRLFEY